MIRVYFQGLRARRTAEAWCLRQFPQEPVQGSWVCADEPSRFVVRVFCGVRPRGEVMLPPWSQCIVVAVDKAAFTAERVVEDTPYRPIIR